MAKGAVQAGESGAIVSEREVRRFVRAQVAVVRWKRVKHRWAFKKCARWAGISPRSWWNAEHGRGCVNSATLARMMVAVNLTVEEVLALLEARKIRHLRRVEVRKNFATIRANGEAEK